MTSSRSSSAGAVAQTYRSRLRRANDRSGASARHRRRNQDRSGRLDAAGKKAPRRTAWLRGRFRRRKRRSLPTIPSRCRSARVRTSRDISFDRCTFSFRFPKPENVANDEQLDVRLSLTDATGQYDLYHAFAEPGQKLDFTVTARRNVAARHVRQQHACRRRRASVPNRRASTGQSRCHRQRVECLGRARHDCSAPSLLSADFARIAEQIACVQDAGAEYLHLDIMDGRFVPNITWGPKIIGDLRRLSPLVFDAHLMIVEPERYVDEFRAAGCDRISVSFGGDAHAQRLLTHIRDIGAKAGLAICPQTPVEMLARRHRGLRHDAGHERQSRLLGAEVYRARD